jgi:hypothetical protein
MYRIVAECAGSTIAERGPRLVFVDRGLGWAPAALFVTGLLALVLGANGAAQLAGAALGRAGGGGPLGAVLLAAAALPGALFAATFAHYRRAARRDLGAYVPTCVVDFEAGWLLSAEGARVAPLADVHFAPRAQFASSARALALVWPGGEFIVYRGNPFAFGTIDDARRALRERGLRA